MISSSSKMHVLATAIVALLVISILELSGRTAAGDSQISQKRSRQSSPLLTDARSPGLAVMVRENGRTVFARDYRVRDLRTFARIDAQTNFRLASCTKQFTAMAIMLLVRDGKLHYDDTPADIFPQFPAYGKAITIRNLLNHTSGVPNYESLMESPANRLPDHTSSPWSDENQIQDAEVLALLEQQKSGKFPPGSKWAYSNSDYVVPGLVAAKFPASRSQSFCVSTFLLL